MALSRREQEEVARSRILFTLMEKASGVEHWKYPFELEFRLASKEHDSPIPKDIVLPIAQEFAHAIEFFHGAAVTINLETMEARPARGEATAYVFFDGYTLKIGSIGYQG